MNNRKDDRVQTGWVDVEVWEIEAAGFFRPGLRFGSYTRCYSNSRGRDTDESLIVLYALAGVIVRDQSDELQEALQAMGLKRCRACHSPDVAARWRMRSGCLLLVQAASNATRRQAAMQEIVDEGKRSKQVAAVIKGEGNAEVPIWLGRILTC